MQVFFETLDLSFVVAIVIYVEENYINTTFKKSKLIESITYKLG